jgi:hypothetical protein
MRKIKLVNKERFEAFLSIVAMAIIVVAIIAIPRPKSPIEKWHDAIDNGQTWAEYVGGEINVD